MDIVAMGFRLGLGTAGLATRAARRAACFLLGLLALLWYFGRAPLEGRNSGQFRASR
jgi:hypothetical protein